MTVRPKGKRWQCDLMVKGKRLRPTFATEEAAKQHERDVLHAVASGRPLPSAKTGRTATGAQLVTLQQLCDHTIKSYWGRMAGSKGAICNARQAVESIGPLFPITEITKSVLLEYCSECFDDGNSQSTVNRKMDAMSKMLTEAVELGVIEKKPSIPRGKEMTVEIRFLTEAEEVKLVTAFQRLGLVEWKGFVEFAVDTGMRLGELMRLRWNHLSGDVVHVWHTKSNKPRSIPLTKRALKALEDAQERDPDGVGPWATWGRSGALKTSQRDQWVKIQGITKLDRRIHDLRHTCASRMVQRGVDIRRVQTFLGHSTITTTLRYAHLAPNDLDVCRAALEIVTKPVTKPVTRGVLEVSNSL